MPLRSGKATPNEMAFAAHYASTGDRDYAAAKAGYAHPPSGASRALARPAVQAEIARVQMERLFTEALPAAVTCLVGLIQNDKAPAGARVQAAKVVMDRTLGAQEAMGGREPHEMNGDELARAIEELTRLAAEKAVPVQASRVDALEPDTGVFG